MVRNESMLIFQECADNMSTHRVSIPVEFDGVSLRGINNGNQLSIKIYYLKT
jgi:hypothetical protein